MKFVESKNLSRVLNLAVDTIIIFFTIKNKLHLNAEKTKNYPYLNEMKQTYE